MSEITGQLGHMTVSNTDDAASPITPDATDMMPSLSPVSSYGTSYHRARGTHCVESNGGESEENASNPTWKSDGFVIVNSPKSQDVVTQRASYDSGADRNAVSLECVRLWGLKPQSKESKTGAFTLADGTKIIANWYCYIVWVPEEWRQIGFMKEPWESRFYILEKPLWHLIIGRLEVFKNGVLTNNLSNGKWEVRLGPIKKKKAYKTNSKTSRGELLLNTYPS